MTTDNDADALVIATQLLGLDAKWLQAFEIEVPFNDNLQLHGFLRQKPDHRYGTLVLTQVSAITTYKLHNPFGKDGTFHFSPIKQISLYEKRVGMDALAYRYRGDAGDRYVADKLHVAPTQQPTAAGARFSICDRNCCANVPPFRNSSKPTIATSVSRCMAGAKHI